MIASNSGLEDAWTRRARMKLEQRILARRLAASLAKLEAEAEAFSVAAMKLQHQHDCRQAFNRPPKRCGRGNPPLRKWEARRR